MPLNWWTTRSEATPHQRRGEGSCLPLAFKKIWFNEKEPEGLSTLELFVLRTAAAYSSTWYGSTIGVIAFNFSVRNG